MDEAERRTEPIKVCLISKEQFCSIMDAIHEQDELTEDICRSLERIADIFAFDVDNKYRKALVDLLVYLFDDTSDWIGYWMYEAYAYYSFSTPIRYGKQSDSCQRSGSWESHPGWVLQPLRREVSLSALQW